MGIRAVRTQDQDVLSSVMRRELITRISPLVSLDRKSNPLSENTDRIKFNRLLKKFGLDVKELLTGLSGGEMSIADFSARTVRIRDEICKDADADGSFLRALDTMAHDIQRKMDGTAANVRRLMHMDDEGPRPTDTKLSNGDAALLSLIEAARSQIGSIAKQSDRTPPPQPPRPIEPSAERQKSLRIIRDSGGQPVKDHPKYGPMLTKFLGSRDITSASCPRMVALYRLLETLPLGQSLGKTEITTRLNTNDAAVNALIERLRTDKKLLLNSGAVPTTPGFFIRVAGRECRKNPGDPSHYCYELVMAVME